MMDGGCRSETQTAGAACCVDHAAHSALPGLKRNAMVPSYHSKLKRRHTEVERTAACRAVTWPLVPTELKSISPLSVSAPSGTPAYSMNPVYVAQKKR